MQVPLIGFIGRLDFQKGADLILGAAHWLLNQDVQLVCLGTGDQSLEACPSLKTSHLPAHQYFACCHRFQWGNAVLRSISCQVSP